MADQSELIDLSGKSNIEILDALEKLLEESEFSKFTLICTRKPKELTHHGSMICKSRARAKYATNLFNRCMSEIGSKRGFTSEQQITQEQDSCLARGMELYNAGMYQQALEILTLEERQLSESLKDGAQNVKAYHDVCFHIGNCHYRLKQLEKAIEWFSREFSGEDAKQQGQKCNNLGSCYASLQQSRLGLKYYGEALKIYGNFPEIDCSNLLNNLGLLYAKSCMYQTAQKYFLQAIEERKAKSPHLSQLLYTSYLHLGNCQKHAKKYKAAISSLTLALNFAERGFGNEAETLMQLAAIYELSQKWTQALDCYEKLSTKGEKKALLFERAAQIYRQMGVVGDYERFIVKAYEEYQLEGNQRKVSQLSSAVLRITQK